ncbi:E3 ubiquitin-protein ligase BIG BROTHER-like isoform X2 [Hibiscus syriacus]|nr:E3 ubiquitin-protein ligase BIG BROTHER-like isoform X2 [Hibiscus syriacus]
MIFDYDINIVLNCSLEDWGSDKKRLKMNENRQMEVHFIDSGFPYTATESFMDFFEGLAHVHVNYTHAGLMYGQENIYWSMSMNAYKFGVSGPESTLYCPNEVNDHLARTDSPRTWDYPSTYNSEQPAILDVPTGGDAVVGMHAIPEECTPNHQSNSNSQVVWQDNIDPDNMTHEELLDLGEALGSQSRGLSRELIELLPTSRCKFGSFLLRKKSRERCVIFQTRYKIGEQQMKLPCKHVYH